MHWCKLRGRALHSVGPATLKALSPIEHSLKGGDGEEMCMKTFKNHKKCFKSHSVLDWEPMQVLKGGGDVFLGPGVS